MNRIFSAEPVFRQQGIGIIRIIVGLMMAYHGWEVFDSATMRGYAVWDQFKGGPSPLLMVYLGKGTELLIGVLLTLGWFTRLASLLLMATMLYIIFFVGHGKIWYEDQHPFLFVLLGVVFVVAGPGAWSIDSAITGTHKATNHER
jgi:putative oxidoreductase